MAIELVTGLRGPTAIELTVERRSFGSARYLLTSSTSGLAAREATPDAIADAAISEAVVFVAEHAAPDIFIHAGVVAFNGQALLLPGSSRSGKSTLVASLVRDGATYFSDEFAVITPSGLVVPYSRPISLRRSGSPEPHRQSAEDLGGVSGTEATPIRAVIFTRFDASVASWNPTRLSPGAGALGLAQNAFAARTAPERVLHAAGMIAKSAAFFEGARPEGTIAAREIREQCLGGRFDA